MGHIRNGVKYKYIIFHSDLILFTKKIKNNLKSKSKLLKLYKLTDLSKFYNIRRLTRKKD